MAEEGSVARIVIPAPPPRLTGNPDQDVVALNQWAWDFYNAVKLSNQALSGEVDPDLSTLPDPANTNLALAQSTANDAYALALSADTTAEAAEETADDNAATLALRRVGQITISNTDNTGSLSLSDDYDDTNYYVFMQAIGTTGSPTTDSLIVVDITKAVGQIDVTIQTAPGASNSVIFDVFCVRLT